MSLLLAVHRRLLPDRPEIGWTPYLWLFYVSFPAWRWFFKPTSTTTQVLGILSVLFFLGVYFNGYWRRGRAVLWNISALVALGVLWTPFDVAGMVFYIYAAGFTGEVGPSRMGRRVLAGIAAIAAAAFLLSGQPFQWALLTVCICGVVGATNIYFFELSRQGDALRRSREEVQHLATIAERERIGRDLHDLLGHTLSLITLKAELARKLSERKDERAAQEIAEVEQISREALRQVREAVEGYREAGLAGEVARARLVCEARGIDLETHIAPIQLNTPQEAALAMILREAITNVARHAKASRCCISLHHAEMDIELEVRDNGQGLARKHLPVNSREGHGIRGMRERLVKLGGHLHLDGSDGWQLRARLPWQPEAKSTAADGSPSENASPLRPPNGDKR